MADALVVCEMVLIEYLMGARSGAHFDQLRDALDAMRTVATEPVDWQRAISVQRALSWQTGGGQRSVKVPDLLIAAVAERAGLRLVHYDEDYDRIAAVTGQATEWVAPRGSL